ncbi:hypothetical protein [uncultured Draconibacterium sp.]|uniref:hypothetical protein n=1 Tax=uncultured Draconibacterium sp. TaxID=1573823 RepID=UPI0029C88A13|nr:hypothetical protein [uncultured Draconibacterium sp.]
MITFAAALREAQFIETMGLRTAKAGPVVGAKISVFETTNGSKKKFRKNFKKYLVETKIALPLQPL